MVRQNNGGPKGPPCCMPSREARFLPQNNAEEGEYVKCIKADNSGGTIQHFVSMDGIKDIKTSTVDSLPSGERALLHG